MRQQLKNRQNEFAHCNQAASPPLGISRPMLLGVVAVFWSVFNTLRTGVPPASVDAISLSNLELILECGFDNKIQEAETLLSKSAEIRYGPRSVVLREAQHLMERKVSTYLVSMLHPAG